MPFNTPETWVPNQIVTAAFLNKDLRDNVNFLHDTHGPLWIPAQRWSADGAYGVGGFQGSDPNKIPHLLFVDASDAIHRQASEMVPDNWIAGGFVVKVHWTPNTTNTGNCRYVLTYLFASPLDNIEAAGASITTDIAGNGVANKVQVDTIGTTSAPTAGELIRLNLNRLGTVDSFAGAARVLGLELEYT